MNPIFAAALEIQDFCRERRWKFCFIGGLAVQRWGEPRLTQDVDLTLLTGFGGEEAFVDTLLQQFRGRRPDARDFALRYRVLLLESSGGTPLDIALGAMPFEERAIGRASDFTIVPGVPLSTCSAEDLIVFKAFAGRERDWLDVEAIALRQSGRLDEALI
ncbi:MAG: nucleotidyl transferase AbiEii/AbiGii toxin family protein, partial [Thermoanaerobaculia bacterium]